MLEIELIGGEVVVEVVLDWEINLSSTPGWSVVVIVVVVPFRWTIVVVVLGDDDGGSGEGGGGGGRGYSWR